LQQASRTPAGSVSSQAKSFSMVFRDCSNTSCHALL